MTGLLDADRLHQLLTLVGRRDVPAYRFADDCATCIGAFLLRRRAPLRGAIPAAVEADLVAARDVSRRLVALLERLPGDVRSLIDLAVLEADAERRIACDVEGLSAPLADLVDAIDRTLATATGRKTGIRQADDALIAAIATSYRNRFGVDPMTAGGAPFLEVLRGVLSLFAGNEPLLSRLRDRLGEAEVRRILSTRIPAERTGTTLELVDDEGAMLLPARRHTPPFVMG